MANPALLFCDSDALTQCFLGNEIRPLRILKDVYGIQPVIVQEVELEMRWLRKYRDRFVPQLEKALKANAIIVLDQVCFQTFLATAPVGASWASFQSLGAQYEGHVHRGEAYTFAGSVTLNMPAMSNDFSAIKTLEANLLSLPTPVLRVFDVFAFCLQNGLLLPKACEAFRSELLKNREGLPKAFMNSSFEDGLKNFAVRLRDGDDPISTTPGTYSTPLCIRKIQSSAD